LGVSTFKAYGADREIEEAKIRTSRPLYKIHFTRQRQFFIDKRREVKLSPTDAMEHGAEHRGWNDPSRQRIGAGHDSGIGVEHDIAVQAVRPVCDKECQTPWFRKVHSAVQVTPVVVDARPQAIFKPEKGPSINEFLHKVMPKFDHACVTNLKLPLFQDDYTELADDDAFLGKGDEAGFTDIGNFQHIKYTKKKRITSIDWHPKSRNLVAVSVGEAYSPDTGGPFTYMDRINRDRKALNGEVVLWDFQDPINPACVLEAPQEVNIIRFCPTNPDLIVGGTINGQVVLWNIASVSGALLKKGKKGQRDKDRQEKTTETQGDGSKAHVMWSELSKIEQGHKKAINDLVWIDHKHEVNTDGKFVPFNPQSESSKAKRSWEGTEDKPYSFDGARQFMTLSSDGWMYVWDLNKENMRRDKFRKLVPPGKERPDIPWIPLWRTQLSRPDGSGDIIGLKLSLWDRGPDPYLAAVGTEEGEFVYVNWTQEASTGKTGFGGGDDHSKVQAVKLCAGFHADGRRTGHHGAVMSVQRHPSLHDYYLTAGDWGFKVWKIGCSDPVVSSPYIDAHVTAGAWSPSRPAVIYVGTADGNVQVWDLLDRSHEQVVTHSVGQEAVTAMEFKPIMADGKRGRDASERTETLAVGVRQGALHVYRLPKALVKPKTNEKTDMERYLEREVVRGRYYAQRWEKRRKEIDEINAQRQQLAQEKAFKPDRGEDDETDNPFADPSTVDLHMEEFKAKLQALEDEE